MRGFILPVKKGLDVKRPLDSTAKGPGWTDMDRQTPKAPVVPELSRLTVMVLTPTEQHVFACVSLRDCGRSDSCSSGYSG